MFLVKSWLPTWPNVLPPAPPPRKFFWPNLKNQLHETTSHEIKPNFLDNFLTLPSTSQLDLDPQTAILLAPKSCTRFFENRFFAIFCCFHFFFPKPIFWLWGVIWHMFGHISINFSCPCEVSSLLIHYFVFDFCKKFCAFARASARTAAREKSNAKSNFQN